MLKLIDVHAYYGRSHILQGVTLGVEKAEVVCLLGRNGVGKSTTLKSIIGLVPPREGKVFFLDQEIQGRRPHEIARLGISYVPEDRRVFHTLTVKMNLMLGAKSGREMTSDQKARNLERMYSYFPILKMREKRPGSTLSGGELQMLTVARGLMSDPLLMLLDEPFEGLAPLIVKELESIITNLCKKEHLTLVLVEQKVLVALRIGTRGYVLEKGIVRFEGSSGYLLESEEVKERCRL